MGLGAQRSRASAASPAAAVAALPRPHWHRSRIPVTVMARPHAVSDARATIDQAIREASPWAIAIARLGNATKAIVHGREKIVLA